MTEHGPPHGPAQSGTQGHKTGASRRTAQPTPRPKRAHLLTPTLLVRFSFAVDLLLGAVFFYRAWERPDPLPLIIKFLILECVFVLFYIPVWWKIRRRNDMSAHMSGAAYTLLRLYAVITSVVWMID